MKKFVIDHFDLRSKELKLLTVLEYIFMFCIVGLSLVLVNQSGEKLTEGSVSVSDAVSITCEALMYLCVVSLLALLHRGLGRVGRVNRVSMCRAALAFAMLQYRSVSRFARLGGFLDQNHILRIDDRHIWVDLFQRQQPHTALHSSCALCCLACRRSCFLFNLSVPARSARPYNSRSGHAHACGMGL